MKGLTPATVEDAAGLVDYQDGSIVSRVIVKQPSGNITIFAFDEGEALSEHKAPYDALVHILDGEAAISVDGKEHLVKAGQMILLPANVPHALQAIQRFKMVLTMIRN